ncbi:MAG TPA: hypothetical protein VMF91_20255 [Bryobacteraceae bacterium]|nr:hypothetical protein [Bryobacteraceae bacterium]
MKEHQNVTLSLPKPLLRRFRVYAAERNQSMSRVMTDAIEGLLNHDDPRESAKRRFLEGIRNAPDWGTGGKITWTRDEIHER